MITATILDYTTLSRISKFQFKPCMSFPPRLSTYFKKNRWPNAVPRARISPTTPAQATSQEHWLAAGRAWSRASKPGDTMKLRISRILNASGHMGRKLGNRAGILGLLYAGIESGMVEVRDTDDAMNSVVAGFGTGALYKGAAAQRSAAVAGAIGGVVVGLAMAGKQMLKRYMMI